MTAELGQTTDPKALIPGDPGAVEDHAKAIGRHSESFDQVGSDLKKVDVVSWTGKAGDAFRESFAQEPPKWLKSSDFLHDVSRTLHDHAGTLRWAQAQASEAIARWQEGEQASKKAVDDHNKAVGQADQENRANASAGSSSRVTVAPFSDPGEKIRQEAQAMLTRARQQLQQAGDRVAEAIAGKDPKTGGGALGSLVDAVTKDWEGKGSAGFGGPRAGWAMSGPGEHGQLGKIEAYADLFHADAKGEIGNKLFHADGEARASLGADAGASAKYAHGTLSAAAQAGVGLQASAEGHAGAGPVQADGEASGIAGAGADASANVGTTGVSADASAYAGLHGKAEGGASVGGIGISGDAEGTVGAGADAKFEAGYQHGKFELGADAGAALGLGGGAGFEITVDPKEVAHTADEAAHAIGGDVGHAADDVDHAVSGAASSVGHAASSVGHTIAGWL